MLLLNVAEIGQVAWPLRLEDPLTQKLIWSLASVLVLYAWLWCMKANRE